MLSIYVQNILNIYSIYEYNIPFNKHLKKFCVMVFYKMMVTERASERNGEINTVFATGRAGQTP